jgi:type II secretion system protein D
MKQINHFILNNLTLFGLCAVIVLADYSFLLGQIVQMGKLSTADTTSVYQSVYNSNTTQAPIRQIQYFFPTASENEPVEPIPPATRQSSSAIMTRHSNLVVPLPPSTDEVSATTPSTATEINSETNSINSETKPETNSTNSETKSETKPETVSLNAAQIPSATEQSSIFSQYSLPQPLPTPLPSATLATSATSLPSSPFLLASHPQNTDHTAQVQFSAPVSPETTTVKPIPTVSTLSTPTLPIPTTPETSAPATPLPHPPRSAPATPTRLIATEAITKNHRLQNVSSETFEQKLVEKLGKRFVPVRNIETTSNLSRFRFPVKDGTDVELSIDRQNGITTIIGSAPIVESCLQIVRLLDSQENAEFISIQPANRFTFRQTAQILNTETRKLAQNATPTFSRSSDQPSAAFVNPNNTAQNPVPPNSTPQNNTPLNTEQTPAGIVGPVQIDVIEGIDEMIVVRGTPKDVAVIMDILRQIETMSFEHEPIIELVPMQHADSYRICQMVQQLYSQVYLARKGNVIMLPLIKPNTILLVGKQESIDTAKELIAKLDTPVAPESEFQIFRLKNASSDALQAQITQFYSTRPGVGQGLEPRVLVVSDARTNTLIVQANPRDTVEVANMILQLDSEGGEATNIVKLFPLKNAMASELATTLQNAISGTASTTPAGGFGGGFGGGGAAASQNSRTRNPMVTLGTIDKDGNLQRANVLYDVRVVADTRSNMLIVTAPPNTMPLIEALIKQLDQLPAAESQMKVFTLVNGDAYTLTTVLTQLFAQTSTGGGGFGGGSQATSQIATVRPGIEDGESTLVSVRFQTDTRTNSIIASGSASDMAIVEALLIRLDEENMNNRKVMILKPLNSRASEIATLINNYATSERQLEIQNSSQYLPQSPAEQYRKEIICVADDGTNSLIVSTTPRYYDQIRKMVQELDERPLMVAIQVLIAEVRINNNRDMGIEIGLQDSLLFDRSLLSDGALTPGFLFGDPGKSLPLGAVRTGTVGTQGITSLGTGRTGENGIGGFTFSASSESVSVLVRALEEQGKLRVLSRPFLTTLHNMQAKVSVGQEVPYITSSDTSSYSGNTISQVEHKKVGTILEILPRVTADGQIVMAVNVEKSNVGSIADGVPIMVSDGVPLNSPKFNSTNAATTVSVLDGQTIVFAGLITEQKETINRSIPGLNKIPIIKHLFEYNSVKCERNELLIVLTPTIIRSESDMQVLRQQEASRMHWCINDVVKLTGNSKMKIRGDEWFPEEVPYIPAAPVILDETQLPSDEKVKQVLPFPTLAPENEK